MLECGECKPLSCSSCAPATFYASESAVLLKHTSPMGYDSRTNLGIDSGKLKVPDEYSF